MGGPGPDDPDGGDRDSQGHGDRQRHARQLLRRRPLRSSGRGAEHARALIAEGADLLDLGGESTRPGSEPVPLEEELRRRPAGGRAACVPEIDRPPLDRHVQGRGRRAGPGQGASIINDITALRGDPEMARVVAESGAGVVLMHMQGQPRTMQQTLGTTTS